MDLSATEADSRHENLEHMSTAEILAAMNAEDEKVARAVHAVLPTVERLIDNIVASIRDGGRLFYMGAGTSGRLGVVDASECPPTFGVSPDMVIGIMAGGNGAFRKAVEGAEDNRELGWSDLQAHNVSKRDVVVGIAASGRTPYVVGALEHCTLAAVTTGCITCSPGSPLGGVVQFPIEMSVGPEFLTGSTRLKAGTAQKMVLNMITTATMIRLGHVRGNKMIDMQATNEKLRDRGARAIAIVLSIDYDNARRLLTEHGSVRAALDAQR